MCTAACRAKASHWHLFVSEDIFTLASYYQADLKDAAFFPSPDWAMLPDDAEAMRFLND